MKGHFKWTKVRQHQVAAAECRWLVLVSIYNDEHEFDFCEYSDKRMRGTRAFKARAYDSFCKALLGPRPTP